MNRRGDHPARAGNGQATGGNGRQRVATGKIFLKSNKKIPPVKKDVKKKDNLQVKELKKSPTKLRNYYA